MPGKVGVKIKAGRNLPVMDRGSDTTDAYVEIKLGTTTHKTDVCRKSLNPQWNTDWFRFEVDDAELQDEPLQIRLMDYDTYSANDAIGKVNISLNPLCLETGQAHSKGTVLSGWIPVFDTMHGIRGEVNVIVKVDLFSDVNKFRQSSCGIPFFHSQCIPFGYRAQIIHGFVEELVVNDDPEYQWIDKIRTPRASNEARQVVFLKLSGQVQRKMGLKAINMGANAVIGYTQCFDLEGDVGVVARGIGTAVTLIKDTTTSISGAPIQPATVDNALIEERTQKYLEFLTGGNVTPGSAGGILEQPKYELQIKRSRSSTLYELRRASSDTAGADLMLELMRQEDERGERPVRKLKHRMRRFTRSSRNILNEKYTAFMHKLSDSGDSSARATSRSLSSLFAALNSRDSIKEDGRTGGSGSLTSVRSSLYDLRKKNFKAKHKFGDIGARDVATKQLLPRASLKKTTHPIARSISDDTAMKRTVAVSDAVPPSSNAANVEYQDNTRSSPNISATAQQVRLAAAMAKRAEIVSSSGSGSGATEQSLFCQFSTHVPHLLHTLDERAPVLNASSSTTLSGSSLSEEDDVAGVAQPLATACSALESLERDKIEALLKQCTLNAVQHASTQWIQPGQQDSVDDEPQPRGNRHTTTLFNDFKEFSQRVQHFILSPKKHKPTTISARQPPQTLSLQLGAMTCAPDARKSYYSSQPEILLISETAEHSSAGVSSSANLVHSRSLNDLSQFAFAATPLRPLTPVFAALHAGVCATAPIAASQAARQPPIFPILKVCPSTPTPSESDASQLSPSEVASWRLALGDPAFLRSDCVLAPQGPAHSSSSSCDTIIRQCTPRLGSESPIPSSHYLIAPSTSVNANNNTNLSDLDSLSLLAPAPSMLLAHDHQRRHHRDHHPHDYHPHYRSFSEVNMSGGAAGPAAGIGVPGITDSPSMKRFGSPASAAIVAAGGAMVVSPLPLNAAGPTLGSRSKLSQSPSKSGAPMTHVVNSAANTQSQSDSISSATTTSTATTILPKDVGEMCRRSSDSDLSVTPKGNSLCVASERLVAATALMRLNQPLPGKSAAGDGMDMLEYPFLTMTKYPPGFILHLGATVAARSVKLLERVPNPDEPEVRDSWWTELRMEIRSHARALGCNVVLGYAEATTISDDVCVLSATGTAAVINMAYNRSVSQTDIIAITKVAVTAVAGVMSASLEERDLLKELRNGIIVGGPAGVVEAPSKDSSMSTSLGAAGAATASASKKYAGGTLPPLGIPKNTCSMCHIPYNLTSVPFNVKMKKCGICRKGRVPDVLMATLEVPEILAVTGRGCFMQAQVVRAKKDLRSELNAKEISDGLPFLEYELHRVLINKLKAKGMNAIFGLRAQVAVGERMIALIATGTALFLSALPVPQVPKIVAGNSWTDKQKLNELQKKLQETFDRNQEIYQLKCIDPDGNGGGMGLSLLDKQSDTDESDDEAIELDLNCGNKDTCVLEVDDIEDLEIISLLMEPYPPEGFHVVNTQMVPGLHDVEAVKNLQMFTQVWRAKLDVGQNINGFPKHFQRLLQTIYFKLRTMIPCAICDLRFRLDLPESDQIQLLVTGMALGLGDASKFKYRRRTLNSNGHHDSPSAGLSSNANATQNSASSTASSSATSNNDNSASAPSSNTAQDSPDAGSTAHSSNKRALQEEDYIFPLDEDQMVETPTPTTNMPPYGAHSFKLRKTSPSRTTSKANAVMRNRFFPLRDRYGIDLTPLSFVPGGRIDKYLGNLNFFFIRESTSIRENGGISGFVHGFITELLAVVRAHIAALGGNAMVSFYMTELILFDNQHKNQGQCLISIGGDAVYVSYYTDD